jgi:hypothetical protein
MTFFENNSNLLRLLPPAEVGVVTRDEVRSRGNRRERELSRRRGDDRLDRLVIGLEEADSEAGRARSDTVYL